ncbi:hypothetical protein FOZ62_011877, partial [Perkinsus olseni]
MGCGCSTPETIEDLVHHHAASPVDRPKQRPLEGTPSTEAGKRASRGSVQEQRKRGSAAASQEDRREPPPEPTNKAKLELLHLTSEEVPDSGDDSTPVDTNSTSTDEQYMDLTV